MATTYGVYTATDALGLGLLISVSNQDTPINQGTITNSDEDPETLNSGDEFSINGTTFTYDGVVSNVIIGEGTGFIAHTGSGTTAAYYYIVPNETGSIQGFTGAGVTNEGWDLATDSACLLEGTLLLTPDGERLVEDLRAGDLVMTADGTAAPIRWIGHTKVSRNQPDQMAILPIRIRAGALGDHLPRRDLLVSPDHAVFIGGTLIQAGALVNGESVLREWSAPKSFTYYHVELEAHSLILAEGTPVETFVDNVDRMSFDNWEEHLQQFGETASIVEMDYPRAKSARQVPSHVRRIIDRERPKFTAEAAA